MPLKPVGDVLRRRQEQLAKIKTGATGISSIISNCFPGGPIDFSADYRQQERVVIVTAASKTLASEILLREESIKQALRNAGLSVDRLIVR